MTIDIRLITDRGKAIDQKTVDEAMKVASEKADDLMGGRTGI
jgi:translation initiation factor IF-3